MILKMLHMLPVLMEAVNMWWRDLMFTLCHRLPYCNDQGIGVSQSVAAVSCRNTETAGTPAPLCTRVSSGK